MTDVTSEKLYEKLDRINNVKRNLKKVMIDIGGYELFQNDPKFETYPEILCTIQDRIEYVNRLLDITVYGKELNGVFTTADITYKKILPYIEEAQSCRMALIDNLNTKGVIADTDETLRSLVGKVLDIRSDGGRVPFEETLLTTNIGPFRVDFRVRGSYSVTEWYEELLIKFYNDTDNDIILTDPFYYITVSDNNYNLSYSNVCYEVYPIVAHSYYDFFVASNWVDTTEIDNFVNSIKANGGHISYIECYASEGRNDTLAVDSVGTLTYNLNKIDDYTYYIRYYNNANSGYADEITDGDYRFCMKGNELWNIYYFTSWGRYDYFYSGSYANLIHLYNQEDVEFFRNYLTNDIVVEREGSGEDVSYTFTPNGVSQAVDTYIDVRVVDNQ